MDREFSFAASPRNWVKVLALMLCWGTPQRVQAAIAPWEIAAVTAGALGIGATEVYKKDLAPEEPRWKTPPALDAALRKNLVWSNTRLASRWSDVMLFGIVPLVSFTAPLATNHSYPRAALTIAEAAVVTGVVTQLAKFSFARARPYAYYSNDYTNPDSKLSFFSGHTSYSFALSLSSAMLLAESYPQHAVSLYATAIFLATVPAYLRIAADKHYFTDVLIGAIVGSAIAYGITRANLQAHSTQWGDERRLVLQRVFVLQ